MSLRLTDAVKELEQVAALEPSDPWFSANSAIWLARVVTMPRRYASIGVNCGSMKVP
jgi:hypothetical protein